MSDSGIKAIAFDYGGVLELNPPGNIFEIICRELGLPLADLRRKYFENNHLTNVENMEWSDVLALCLGQLGATEEQIAQARQIVRDYRSGVHLNRELIERLPRLKQSGYKLAILSNNTTNLRIKLGEDDITGLFDVIVISGEIGYQKPQPEAFRILFERLGVEPREVVFVDDSPKSLETAGEIGYAPVLFRDNAHLFADLLELGIRPDVTPVKS